MSKNTNDYEADVLTFSIHAYHVLEINKMEIYQSLYSDLTMHALINTPLLRYK